jgi:hypothetical protein
VHCNLIPQLRNVLLKEFFKSDGCMMLQHCLFEVLLLLCLA